MLLLMKKAPYSIIIPSNVRLQPSKIEISAAIILSDFFHTDIQLIPKSNYKTPDFVINNLFWELKSPTGKGKYNIQHALRSAVKQSENIIFDARYSKLHIAKIKHELNFQFQKSRSIRRLIMINKAGPC